MKEKYFSFFSALFIFTLFIYIFAFPKNSSGAVLYATELCVKSVVPAVFPVLVLSQMLLYTKPPKAAEKLCSFFSHLLFVKKEICAPFLLSLICSFPFGAIYAVEHYENGKISKREAELILALCNNPSPAFIISFAGTTLLDSVQTGFLLYFLYYICLLVSSKIVFKIYPQSKELQKYPRKTLKNTQKTGQLVNSVVHSCRSMQTICAFILFFSIVNNFVQTLFEKLSLDLPIFLSVIISATEMTYGISFASKMLESKSIYVIAFALGLCGLCVIFQISSFCKGILSLKPMLLQKFIMSLLLPLFVHLAISLKVC